MLVLLFGPAQEFLGELTFDEGALKQVILSHRGEELLGEHVSRWTTRGIPIQRGFSPKQHKEKEISFHEYIPQRSHEALVALYQWFQDHQILAIDIVQQLIPFWERLLKLPFLAQERLAVLLALRKTISTSLEEWTTCFNEMERVQSVEMEKFERAKAKATKKASQIIVQGMELSD